MEKIRQILDHLKSNKLFLFGDQLAFRYTNDKIDMISAQLTYYLILSIFPFIISLLNIMSYTPLASEDVLTSLLSVLPTDTANMFYNVIEEIIQSSSKTLLSMSAILGLLTAASGIRPILVGLNNAYSFKESRSFVKLKLQSLLFTIGLIFLIILVFVSFILGATIARKISIWFPHNTISMSLIHISRVIITIAYSILSFSILYKFGPDTPKYRPIKFKSTLPGALFASFGWMIVSYGFSFYVNNFGKYSLTYGSLGAIIVFLIWLYICSNIILIGGEINATLDYFKRHNWEFNQFKSAILKF